MRDRAAPLNPLFSRSSLYNPWSTDSENPGNACIVWFEKDRIFDALVNLQAWAVESSVHQPDRSGNSISSGINDGQIKTVKKLWEFRDDEEKVAALLICASLFTRLLSERTLRKYPENWPHKNQVTLLLECAESQLGIAASDIWSPYNINVLPWRSRDFDYKIEETESLVRYLAEEHATALQRYQPTQLVYVGKLESSDPIFLEKVRQKEAEEERLHEERRRNQEKRDSIEKAELAENRKVHSRFGEWRSITDKELTQLAWSHPFVELAKQFGVSDTLIKRRCDARGIPRPPAGFWNKVKCASEPHPKGIPPKWATERG